MHNEMENRAAAVRTDPTRDEEFINLFPYLEHLQPERPSAHKATSSGAESSNCNHSAALPVF